MQILREAPALHKLATRDVVNLSNQSKTEMFARGECIIKSGAIMEKVYVIAEGQVR
jgi:signal-transduction protein with cAMP-binding, CBS, and nucleotidyltransferase domain